MKMMEANTNVVLPPRKRLLSCMKKQNGNSYDLPSAGNDFDTRLSNLLSAHLSDDNPSQEEMVKASRSAAEVAVKIAIAARAAAEEKAVIATLAMAAAKKALELVAEQGTEGQLKKDKQVQMLYADKNKKPMAANDKRRSDQELARQLHQAINNSPRISKCGSKHKRMKIQIVSENLPSSSNRNQIICDKIVNDATKINKLEMSNEGKRGRMKQKKLPLSIRQQDKTIEKNSLWKCESFKGARLKQDKDVQL